MKTLRRPRTWIALLAAFLASSFVTVMSPWPDRTVRLTAHVEPGTTGTHFLRTITSDGRFLITSYEREFIKNGRGAPPEVRVWDCHDLAQPFLVQPGPNDFCSVNILLSKDEQTLAISFWDNDRRKDDLHMYDLTSSRKTKHAEVEAGRIALGEDDTVHVVKEDGVFELETGRARLRFAEAIPGFTFYAYPAGFAYFRTAREGWLYRLNTGEKHGPFPIPDPHFVGQYASADGQVIGGYVTGDPKGGNIRFHALLDLARGEVRTSREDDSDFNHLLGISSDGETILFEPHDRRPSWLRNWMFRSSDRGRPCVAHWQTRELPVDLGSMIFADFSHQGNQLVVRRRNDVFEIYDLPFRTPWGLMALAAIVSGASCWCVGWLWSRWRSKRPGGAV